MIRQLDINYLRKTQGFLIPYATLNAFITTKYYLPIASLKKKLDKSIGFYIAAKIKIPILVLSLIFHVAYGYGLDGFVLGLAMGANLIATDFCRYYFIVFDNVDTAISVSISKLLVFISSIPLITIKAYYSMPNVWLVLNLFSTIISFIGLLKITKNINLRWLYSTYRRSLSKKVRRALLMQYRILYQVSSGQRLSLCVDQEHMLRIMPTQKFQMYVIPPYN